MEFPVEFNEFAFPNLDFLRQEGGLLLNDSDSPHLEILALEDPFFDFLVSLLEGFFEVFKFFLEEGDFPLREFRMEVLLRIP